MKEAGMETRILQSCFLKEAIVRIARPAHDEWLRRTPTSALGHGKKYWEA